jgi:methylase of polypeptide subunit release factors
MRDSQNITYLFKEDKLNRQILVATNENMYTLKEKEEENWLYYSFFAFHELSQALSKNRNKIKSFVSIGTGNGVDAIGAAIIFKGLKKVIITDINQNALSLSKRNILLNSSAYSCYPRVYSFRSNLCDELIKRRVKVDLVYGNLPNVPSSENLSIGIRSASFYKQDTTKNKINPVFNKYLLEMQSLFLRSAKEVLHKGGMVIPIIGGRVPYRLFQKMFEEEGYSFEEICSGFKLQTEIPEMLPAYEEYEDKNEVCFDFYLYNECKELLRENGISNPTANIKGDELKEILKEFKVSAHKALQLSKSGVEIGHTCHVFKGVKE